ncbi:hypothetical protein BP5796_12002 [Coleophoma crateriformis]|uniref:Uncharacterized protein n=1 Tax=Coleophoma crateriformis TaxID=565419 RepID=A0A3D8QBU0_9HELO|nr:hypothetical protein BP5796_12002 [Coleophoma crateriformis]
MKADTIFATITALAISASGATLPKRQGQSPVTFDLYGGFNCQAPSLGHFEMSTETSACEGFFRNQTVQAINVDYIYERCTFEVFKEADCSGVPTVLGSGGCYSDAAGLKASKLICNVN